MPRNPVLEAQDRSAAQLRSWLDAMQSYLLYGRPVLAEVQALSVLIAGRSYYGTYKVACPFANCDSTRSPSAQCETDNYLDPSQCSRMPRHRARRIYRRLALDLH